MPKYTPSEDDMDESYTTPVEKPAPEKQSVDEENAGEDTALISNKILSPDGEPLKEGDEIVVQVVKNYGDECEVKYAPKKGGEKTSETTTPAEDFAAMDTEGE